MDTIGQILWYMLSMLRCVARTSHRVTRSLPGYLEGVYYILGNALLRRHISSFNPALLFIRLQADNCWQRPDSRTTWYMQRFSVPRERSRLPGK